jgi:hypothetical protein
MTTTGWVLTAVGVIVVGWAITTFVQAHLSVRRTTPWGVETRAFRRDQRRHAEGVAMMLDRAEGGSAFYRTRRYNRITDVPCSCDHPAGLHTLDSSANLIFATHKGTLPCQRCPCPDLNFNAHK